MMRSYRSMPRMLAMFALATIAVPATVRAGASEWRNLAPYSDDVAKVMEQLKWEVLRSVDYYKRNPKRKPRSPEQALQMSGEDGTHSIMDMLKVSLVEAGPVKGGGGALLPRTEV